MWDNETILKWKKITTISSRARSFLSVIAKVYEGAEEMAVRMWSKKVVQPTDSGVKLTPS